MKSDVPEDRRREFEVWQRIVRDPAEESSDGVRTISVPGATADYEICSLPNGKWAIRYCLRYWSGERSRRESAWMEMATRHACVEAFMDAARAHFLVARTSETQEKARRPKLCDGPLITDGDLRSAGAYEKPKEPTRKRADKRQASLGFGDESE